jgi:hypothetical protein
MFFRTKETSLMQTQRKMKDQRAAIPTATSKPKKSMSGGGNRVRRQASCKRLILKFYVSRGMIEKIHTGVPGWKRLYPVILSPA